MYRLTICSRNELTTTFTAAADPLHNATTAAPEIAAQ